MYFVLTDGISLGAHYEELRHRAVGETDLQMIRVDRRAVGYYRYVIGGSEGHNSSCFCQASTPRNLKEKKQVSQRKDERGENTNKDEYRRWQDQYCTLTSGWRTSAHFFSKSVLNPYPERSTVAKGTAFRNHRTKQWNMSWMTIETHEYTATPRRRPILDPAFG
jgi:hypothetical protein